MFAAVALVAYLVHPGDTLSGIAASHGVSLAAVETANPHLANPNLIYAGQTLEIPKTSSTAQATTATAQTSTATQSATQSASQSATQSASSAGSPSSIAGAVTQANSGGSAGYSSSDLSDIPGVPSSLAACVAYRESTDLQNPAANGNAYGIIPASGYNVDGTSLAQQKQVFAELYQQDGASPWAADGCPGT